MTSDTQHLVPFRLGRGHHVEAGTLLREGLVRTVIGDVVASAAAPDDPWLRAQAAKALLGEPSDRRVVGFTSAAWVFTGYHRGLPGSPAGLEVLVGPGQRRPAGRFLRGRQVELAPADVTELFGLPVTTPVRTAADVARDLEPVAALTVLHHLGSAAGVRPGQVLRQLSRMRYTRGCARARRVIRAWEECL